MKLRHNLFQLLLAIDQFLNVLLFAIISPRREQWADESLSAHCWRIYLERGMSWPYKLVNSILWFDKDHCKEAYESEIERRQLPPSMREVEQ